MTADCSSTPTEIVVKLTTHHLIFYSDQREMLEVHEISSGTFAKQNSRLDFTHFCWREQKYCRQQTPFTYWAGDKQAYAVKIKTSETRCLTKIGDHIYSGDRLHALENFPQVIESTSCRYLLGDVIRHTQFDGISCHPNIMQRLKYGNVEHGRSLIYAFSYYFQVYEQKLRTKCF